MTIRQPFGCTKDDYVQLYAVTDDKKYHVVKTNLGTYTCSCPSILDECEHIEEFKKEEPK